MEIKNWQKIKNKYRKINLLKQFENDLEQTMINNLLENKNTILFDEKTTAKRLSIGYSTLKLIRRNGGINFVRIGKNRVRYTLKNIEQFIEKSAVSA